MRPVMMCFLICLLAGSGLVLAEEGPIAYSVQVIRGTDSDQPPEPGIKKAGLKLSETLRCTLKWKNYWEIENKRVEVLPGHIGKVQLSREREVEINLRNSNTRTVAVFQKGKLLERTSVPQGDGITLIGANRDENSVWFVAVRRF